MPFDDSKFYATPNNGDVAGVAITASLSLTNIAFALEAIQKGDTKQLAMRIADIRKGADDLDELFTKLSGYTPPK